MKKFAIKGLIILAAAVLLCIFFSGTLHTITTAKVRITKAKTGYFESEITMNGKLEWPDTVSLTMDSMGSEDTLIVRRVPVSAGSYVREGDVIAECAVSNYQGRLETMQASYSAKEKEALELERKNSGMILTAQQQEWYAAYRRVQDTREQVQLLRQDLRLAAWKAGITLDNGDRLPENSADETLTEFRAQLDAAEAEEAAAEREFDKMKFLSIPEETVTYLDKKAELEKDMQDLSGEMTTLRILNEEAAAIRAPHTGYITSTELKAGDQITGETVLAAITAPDMAPVIRLDPGDSKRVIDVGTPVTLSVGEKTAESVICAQGVKADGGPYLDAEVTRAVLSALGGVTAVSEDKAVTAKMVSRAENSTTLIPSTALRGSAGDYYIYVANSEEGTLGAGKMTIAKKKVTVLDMSESVVSISESLKNDAIVYLEDRQLTDGCEVMQY